VRASPPPATGRLSGQATTTPGSDAAGLTLGSPASFGCPWLWFRFHRPDHGERWSCRYSREEQHDHTRSARLIAVAVGGPWRGPSCSQPAPRSRSCSHPSSPGLGALLRLSIDTDAWLAAIPDVALPDGDHAAQIGTSARDSAQRGSADNTARPLRAGVAGAARGADVGAASPEGRHSTRALPGWPGAADNRRCARLVRRPGARWSSDGDERIEVPPQTLGAATVTSALRPVRPTDTEVRWRDESRSRPTMKPRDQWEGVPPPPSRLLPGAGGSRARPGPRRPMLPAGGQGPPCTESTAAGGEKAGCPSSVVRSGEDATNPVVHIASAHRRDARSAPSDVQADADEAPPPGAAPAPG
jgi:hypothetical protein